MDEQEDAPTLNVSEGVPPILLVDKGCKMSISQKLDSFVLSLLPGRDGCIPRTILRCDMMGRRAAPPANSLL